MTKHSISLILAAFVVTAPLTAEAAPAKSPTTTKTTTKPSNSSTKSKKATKAAKKPPMPPGMSQPPFAGHTASPRRAPGAPMPVSSKNNYEVPQAQTLSDTPDVVLNSRVRATLLSALSSGGQEILAKTTKGVVTLTGSVATAPLRTRAEQAARKVSGVRGVKNQITVKPAARVSKG